jgi:chemosensory pili system protein ChpA (sensor histidine kinase/response regulator)
VVQAGLGAIRSLADDPSDMGQQTTLRRAFHTLKGSSRMVGFNEFGEAAWSLEQLLNTWLAEQKPASPELVSVAGRAMHGFDRWVEDIAAGEDAPWNAQAFRRAADGLRLDNTEVALVFPGEEVQGALPDETPHVDFVSTQIIDLDVTQAPDVSRALAADGAGGLTSAVWVADEPLALDDFDFGVDVDVTPSSDEAAAGLDAQDQVETFSGELAELASEVDDFEPEPQQASLLDLDLEEQVKVIGSLRIGIPLYNVYLNEADELSRRLLTELSEWALELHRPVSETTVALAHSLAGSSATVGFFALSEMARALEHALQHVRLHVQGIAEHAQAFIAAAEDMRRLLHQFAAGFLKEPDQALLDASRLFWKSSSGVSAGVVTSFYYEMLDESQIPEPFDVDESAVDAVQKQEAEEAEAEAKQKQTKQKQKQKRSSPPVIAEADLLMLVWHLCLQVQMCSPMPCCPTRTWQSRWNRRLTSLLWSSPQLAVPKLNMLTHLMRWTLTSFLFLRRRRLSCCRNSAAR